jgi:demethylmenaquinone methyltransferase/2-methoxy-6-polyprenyl-1,4-benzoquinol methylase
MKQPEIYDTDFVEGLFDRMSKTYGITNYISSFGFSEVWRIKCVASLQWKPGGDYLIYDLMSGMGECWKLIRRKTASRIVGVDISKKMIEKSSQMTIRDGLKNVEAIKEDVLNNNLTSGSADYIISTFGLKNFNDQQLKQLAYEVSRLLKDGGQFSFLEISVPSATILRSIYMFYLVNVIPKIGKHFANDDFSYRYLGIYTESFGNAQKFCAYLREANLNVEYVSYFFGCATGAKGHKG